MSLILNRSRGRPPKTTLPSLHTNNAHSTNPTLPFVQPLSAQTVREHANTFCSASADSYAINVQSTGSDKQEMVAAYKKVAISREGTQQYVPERKRIKLKISGHQRVCDGPLAARTRMMEARARRAALEAAKPPSERGFEVVNYAKDLYSTILIGIQNAAADADSQCLLEGVKKYGNLIAVEITKIRKDEWDGNDETPIVIELRFDLRGLWNNLCFYALLFPSHDCPSNDSLHSNYPLLLTNAPTLLVNRILVWLRIRFNCNSMRYLFDEIQLHLLMNNLENAEVRQAQILTQENQRIQKPLEFTYKFPDEANIGEVTISILRPDLDELYICSSLSVIHTPPTITALLSVYLPSRFDLSSLMLKQVTTESFSFSREGLIMMFNNGNSDTIKGVIKAVMAMISNKNEKWKRKTS
ncbi:11747_t:CDS:2 [Paraglomus brasilianum]|uniref:11747_t:CDS:1 n=1 Tax=Paraglomus brasilianum TaxID=144538 RepID=A0A9N8Z3M4_9GLOM|nr:11747_t:CDS:2 [Paraglomus brasilianum]